MSFKKIVALVLVFAVLAVAGTAFAADVKIGVVTPDADHGFTGESVAHARAELEKEAKDRGFEYKFEVGGEAQKQIDAIDTILAWQPNVIILWPIEGQQLKNEAQKIMDAGVQLIIYDRLIDGFTPTAQIMGDNETIGHDMGKYLMTYFGDTPVNYLRFIGDSSTVSVQRSKGMDDEIATAGKTAQFKQLQDDFLTNWSNATAQEQMENWLNTSDKATIESLNCIVTHDDEVVDGVVVALQNYFDSNPAAKLGVKLITSVGGRRETLSTFFNDDNTEKTVAGGMEIDTYYFSPSYIREAIKLGVAAAYGEQYDKTDIKDGHLFLIPTKEINKDTVADYRASQDFADRYSIQ